MNDTDTIATSAKYGEGDWAIYARAESSSAVYIETNGGPRAVGESNIADVCEDENCAYALADLADELHRNGRNDELAELLDEQLISNGRADLVDWFAGQR